MLYSGLPERKLSAGASKRLIPSDAIAALAAAKAAGLPSWRCNMLYCVAWTATKSTMWERKLTLLSSQQAVLDFLRSRTDALETKACR
jgi:hypothetical protein